MKPLEKIVHKLIINGSLTEQPGLFYGKTGIAVFFFHYAQHTGNDLFQEYAMDLIEAIQKQITDNFIIRYDIGLAGIGTGFEYLLQNDLLDAAADLFDDYDDRMYRAAMYEKYPDLSLQEGLTGWGRYFIYRLKGNCNQDNKLQEALTHIADEIVQKILNNTVSENEQPDVYRFLHDATKIKGYAEKYRKILNECRKWERIKKPDTQNIFPYINHLQRLYACQNYFNMDLTEKISQEWEKWEETDKNSMKNMGFLNGWTSNALLHLTHSNKLNVSWINLL